ncbi:UDP-N-acetylmuramoyl-L-alanine--D-glutamate ligase [Alkalitalea saponilacus]|uniref:UDP-N-acetylmuramoylalanine--D-glutamate ligase n=1 Tax=Alkalitalea saponilacus TaxID=889453 RepID=A0A1T5HRE8_9BACT|nr:UDP-N-acetylmuramoyl-L-alanine--D-glutamate ligase [Alkalitalea saponilacus]ASB48396.1 UDP-N-acetylmuramoyl-L-alanine--D-glutamate ligase [Alkalitalea saponilacus]SKC23111.1 UDP-N-acetylmuramoylalanine--D-glutamate ligase [Alkalitalea saponilacus]
MQKKIVILGAGESGTGAALLAKSKGFKVFVSDMGQIAPGFRRELEDNNILFEEGQHSFEKFAEVKEVIKSPGIPDSAPIVVKLKSNGVSIISDIEFAGRYSKAHIIGITGSNGKTTTTLWLHHIMKMAGLDAVLSGNIGVSPCRTLVERDPDYFVMELSSFQLDGIFSFRVNTAVITNITPDHLDRYEYRMDNYVASKFRIIQNQLSDDCFIWCLNDDVINRNLRNGITPAHLMPFSLDKECAARVEDMELRTEINERKLILPINEISLTGKHNLYNAMAASLAAMHAGVEIEAIKEGLRTFGGVEHRLEKVGEKNGVLFINDSKATNVNSTWYALDSMKSPVVWIAGGTDKGNDYSELNGLVKEKVKALVCMGLENTPLKNAFGTIVPKLVETKSMEEAVKIAKELAVEGDVVLLSPACASFDLFKNYEHRGNLFKEMVGKTQ